jgi:hypothetical protein
MIFEPESASTTAIRPGVGALVESAAEALLLDLRRGYEPWRLPGGSLPKPLDNPRAIW